MASKNSFDTRTPLTAGGQTFEIFSLRGAREGRLSVDRPAAVLAEDPAREPAAPRGRAVRRPRGHPGAGGLGRHVRSAEGDCLHAGARAAAGLHRRAGGRRSGRDARRHGPARRRSAQGQPAAAGRAGHRSLGAGRSLHRGNSADLNAALEFTRNRERYTFLRWGQEAFHNFRVVPPDTGIVHQVNLEYLARVIFREEADGRAARLPGHAGRHRLAHHDGQRPRRGRAGASAGSRRRRRCSASRSRC